MLLLYEERASPMWRDEGPDAGGGCSFTEDTFVSDLN